MSQDFRFRYRELRDNDPTSSGDASSPARAGEAGEWHPADSRARNLCILWPEGRRLFLNYAYLVCGELDPDQSVITLAFTSHKVEMTGLRLEELYMALMDHTPKVVVCMDPRYTAITEDGVVVHTVVVTPI